MKLELSHEGYDLDVVHDGISGLLKYREIQPHLIILDWHISIFSAVDLCYRLRDHHNSILVLDTEQRTSDRVAALNAGADDCISIPFAMDEFVAKIKVQLRKHTFNEQSSLVFEDLRLNTLTREVYRGDRYIYLTTKEFALLEYLLTYPRQVLTRTQILDSVWGYEYTKDSNIIEVYIRYLRLKLEENNSKRLIYTVRSVGYVLRESSFY
ncbi:MAG: response regulator transcription factor [Cyanobacteria bacterium P01_G01_bin.19]